MAGRTPIIHLEGGRTSHYTINSYTYIHTINSYTYIHTIKLKLKVSK